MTNMPTTAWDDMMPGDEAKNMALEHKVRRQQMPRWGLSRYKFWYLDRIFFRNVEKGATVNEARENAISAYALRCGLFFGALLAAIAFAFATWLWGAVTAGEWVNIALNLALVVVVFAISFTYATKGFKALRRKVTSKEE